MNLTEYLPLTDRERFMKYAQENAIAQPYGEIDKDAASYFDADVGDCYGDVTVYDFNSVDEICGEITRISEGRFKQPETLAKITAAALLKNRPPQAAYRDIYKAFSAGEWDGKGNAKHAPDMPPDTKADNKAAAAAVAELPDFYYPM